MLNGPRGGLTEAFGHGAPVVRNTSIKEGFIENQRGMGIGHGRALYTYPKLKLTVSLCI